MIMWFIRLVPTICLFLFSTHSTAQVTFNLKQAEDSLKVWSANIQNAGNDSLRLDLNRQFEELMYKALLHQKSFDYPFDSLKSISKLLSPDKKFRIYTWNLPKGDGTNLYFGILQMNPKGKEQQTIYRLTDRSDSISQPESAIVDERSWFGAIYYKIIMTSFNNQAIYTLLGWDGVNSLLSQKIIEILRFDMMGKPRFGANIFRDFGNDQLSRIFFRYSSSATMLLTYDDQFVIKEKRWNSSQRQYETESEKTRMIVCDELVPLDPQMEGQFEYYVPSSEVFNGFIFEKGLWNYCKNIDARNKSR